MTFNLRVADFYRKLSEVIVILLFNFIEDENHILISSNHSYNMTKHKFIRYETFISLDYAKLVK